MAMTNTLVFAGGGGDRRMHVWKCTFDSSYATGGEALTASDLGFSDHASLLTVVPIPSGDYIFKYDAANAKIMAYTAITAAGGAAAAGTDAISLKASVINKEAATGMSSPLLEVVSAKDLSAVTAILLVFGKTPSI